MPASSGTSRTDLGSAPEEHARYVEANRLGAVFTARLLAHVVARRLDRLLEALRYAYRLGAEAKLRHLARAGLSGPGTVGGR